MKRSIVANVAGSLWGFLLSLAAIPLQIRLLGAEAYGLIGFITSLQVILVVLDFGLSTSVVREIAGDKGETRQSGREVAQVGATIYWIVALAVGAILFLAADPIARRWLIVETLTPEYTAAAVRIMAVYLTFTWTIGHYANILFGLNRLDVVNLLKIALATLSQGGAIVLLLVIPDLHALLAWLAFAALVGTVVHLIAARRLFPGFSVRPFWSRAVIRRIWRVSFDMNLVSTASVIFSQADKLLISLLLPLSLLGYYNVAAKLMLGIALIPSAVASSALPSLTAKYASGQMRALKSQYDCMAQLVLYLIVGATFGFVFFGGDVLRLWTSDATALHAARALGLLVIGNMLNAVTQVTYALLIAADHTRELRRIYVSAVPIYLALLYVLTHAMGIEGAALGFGAYSLYLIGTMLVYAQRRVFGESVIVWLNRNLTPFALIGASVFALCRLIVDQMGWRDGWLWIAALGGAAYLLIGFLFLHADTRLSIIDLSWIAFVRLRHLGV